MSNLVKQLVMSLMVFGFCFEEAQAQAQDDKCQQCIVLCTGTRQGAIVDPSKGPKCEVKEALLLAAPNGTESGSDEMTDAQKLGNAYDIAKKSWGNAIPITFSKPVLVGLVSDVLKTLESN